MSRLYDPREWLFTHFEVMNPVAEVISAQDLGRNVRRATCTLVRFRHADLAVGTTYQVGIPAIGCRYRYFLLPVPASQVARTE